MMTSIAVLVSPGVLTSSLMLLVYKLFYRGRTIREVTRGNGKRHCV